MSGLDLRLEETALRGLRDEKMPRQRADDSEQRTIPTVSRAANTVCWRCFVAGRLTSYLADTVPKHWWEKQVLKFQLPQMAEAARPNRRSRMERLVGVWLKTICSLRSVAIRCS